MYISLGSTCSVKYQLRNNNIDIETLPFDWVRTIDLEDINDCIQNNFIDYTNNIIQISISDKFNYIQDDTFDISNTEVKTYIVKNKYNIKFYHDLKSLDQSELENFKQKYQRRIDRFYNIIKSNNKITFIRDELNIKKITIDKIYQFIKLIQNINKDILINFILILYNPNNINYDHLKLTNVNNINLRIINDTNDFGDWIRPNIRWKQLFFNQ